MQAAAATSRAAAFTFGMGMCPSSSLGSAPKPSTPGRLPPTTMTANTALAPASASGGARRSRSVVTVPSADVLTAGLMACRRAASCALAPAPGDRPRERVSSA